VGRTLAEVAAHLQVPIDAHHADIYADIVVESVGIDSRSLTPGSLWVAYPGSATHAATHAAPNAVAAVTDARGAQLLEPRGLPVLVVDDPRQVAGHLASWLVGDPSASMTVIGVTGTNGKTTVTHLLESALQEAGRRTGIIGTLGARIDDNAVALARTTPEAPDLQALLASMRDAGVDVVSMEVSSHALVLGRVNGITFDVSVFTNLSRDHLDFHQDMDDYFSAKSRLFLSGCSEQAVICVDDEWGRRLVAEVSDSIPVLTYGSSIDADVRVHIDDISTGGMTVVVSYLGAEHRGTTSLIGAFNAVNLAGAFGALVCLGHAPDEALTWLACAAGVPGRMERVSSEPSVIVDYAHTPDAVRTVLESVSGVGSRLITVLGCGGDRDVHKRPLMGAIAGELSDILIVTDDNPRSEPPEDIRAAIIQGAHNSKATVFEVADRAAAVERSLSMAGPQDVVLILGKGAEQGQEVSGHVHPFDDRDVARRLMQERIHQ
jgi:UDP-N-acetylmuramoyl-L-alanyl-D-glutamate--2,6-diaminopimelate ligase